MQSLSDAANATKDFLLGTRHKYRAVSAPDDDANVASRLIEEHRRRWKLFKLSVGVMVLGAVLFLAVAFGRDTSSIDCAEEGSCTGNSHKSWGNYSPYFKVKDKHIDPDIPPGCDITMVVMLSRHGSRYPTATKGQAYKSMVDRIQKSVKDYGQGYHFIKKYKYSLGGDDMTKFGEKEMVHSGKDFYKRYKKLATRATEPFIRASGSGRVIMSAQNFTHGFFKPQSKDGADFHSDILVIPEGSESNNTLDHGTCVSFEDGPSSELADTKRAAWRDVWAKPIRERLNRKLPGADLTLEEAVFMMDLCPFNSVAHDKATHSPFCRLFSKEEWRQYDYDSSLNKWYGYGPGNPLGPTQGVGYVNELIARLTNMPVTDHTSTNSTLDEQAPTFPLNRKLFVDFTHDNTMMSIYGALGLYNQVGQLPVDRRVPPSEAYGFSSSFTMPFASRMYVEKMQCNKADYELVRILVDHRVVPLQGCDADKLGRCKLDDFVHGLSFARGDGRWSECRL